MEITIEIKYVYGKTLFYPVCETARGFSRLTGKVTLSKDDLAEIEKLGYNITVMDIVKDWRLV